MVILWLVTLQFNPGLDVHRCLIYQLFICKSSCLEKNALSGAFLKSGSIKKTLY